MTERNYEVEEFKTRGETRWRIVEKETGKVLDDAQGWGYKSRQNAHIGWGYNSKTKEERDADYNRKKAVWKWFCDHREVSKGLDNAAWWAIKDGEEMDAKTVAALLGDLGLETEFKPREILSVWRKGEAPLRGRTSKERREEREALKRERQQEAWEWICSHADFKKALEDGYSVARNEGLRFNGGNVADILSRFSYECGFRPKELWNAFQCCKGGGKKGKSAQK